MSEATFTFRADEALKTEFATAAKARDRSSAQLVRDFMREYVQRQEDVAGTHRIRMHLHRCIPILKRSAWRVDLGRVICPFDVMVATS